jgi:hypothetical protein
LHPGFDRVDRLKGNGFDQTSHTSGQGLQKRGGFLSLTLDDGDGIVGGKWRVGRVRAGRKHMAIGDYF